MASVQELDDSSESLMFDPASPVWADVVPIPQNDGPLPLCQILYDPKYSEAMDLFRALRARPQVEASERVLALTEHLVHINPANYSVWNFRMQALTLMDSDETLRRELDFLDDLAHSNMKNYQVWQHRRIIVALLGDPSRELSFSAENLAIDAKNYHTWAYREWVLAHFGTPGNSQAGRGAGEYPELWDGELAFVDKLLDEDVRNNSAWSHRWFCCFGRESGVTREDEIAYVAKRLAVAPNNGSAWNYLRGLHRKLEPILPFSASDQIALEYISNADHASAAADPAGDEAGKTPPGALEWLFESAVETYTTTKDDSASSTAKLHVGQGVRYNAEKRQVGMYHSTPIYSFKCKCHLCSGEFAIRTDPQNTRYVVEYGAREQLRDWVPEDGGQIVIERKGPGADDPFAQVEKHKGDTEKAKEQQGRLAELEIQSETHWADPYTKNKELRRQFREEKRQYLARQARDAELRKRIGWADNRVLAGEATSEPGYTDAEVHSKWETSRDVHRNEQGNVRCRARRPQRRSSLDEF
ncbi:galactose-6-sulfurylase [Malassezia cuniculi]|uniref:Protein farnesyltransferase/geranylgeranyltransferase type-1 subunit alpha n=1 Tax=Malassezia cuniculi TaxID=948313 RepID=A0AAF0ESM0_9BASI|nr:galactose-6-sulfurylase [Malassezia cuniculi]